jgi:hypothetical protein
VRTKLNMPTSAKGKRNERDDDDKRWLVCEDWIENTKFRRRHLAWRIEVLCASWTSRLNLLLLFWSNSFSSAARPGRWLSPCPRRPGPSSAVLYPSLSWLFPLISYLPHHLSSLVACGGRRVLMCVPGAISRACHEVRLLIGWPAARRLTRRPSSQREAWAVKLSELLVCRIRGGSRAVSPS